MTRNTEIGKMYAVSSAAGCTVTTADGLPLCTVEAGAQGYFTAPTATVEIDDEAALLTKSNFNLAALALGSAGGGKVNPYEAVSSWVELAELLPAIKDPTAKVTLTLPAILSRDGSVVNVDELTLTIPRKVEGVSMILINIRAKKAKIFLPKMTGLTAMMKQNYVQEYVEVHAPEATSITELFHQDGWSPSAAKTDYYLYAPKATKVTNCADQLSKLGTFECYAPEAVTITELVIPMRYNTYSKTARLKLTLGNVTSAKNAFSCCKYVPDEDFPRSWAYLKYGSGMFNACELGGALAVDILNSLQAATAETGTDIWCITMGIHVDHQSDEAVIAAIEAAEAKGWTVTVQWNGTATAAASNTYGLRRRPVWVKLGEPMKDGTPALDWGHYVTNAEANGYTEFASLEEAKEHFNITD